MRPRRGARGNRMTQALNKRIGVLFGMEDTFPWALINEINALANN